MDHERGAHVAYLPEIGAKCPLQLANWQKREPGRGCSGGTGLGWSLGGNESRHVIRSWRLEVNLPPTNFGGFRGGAWLMPWA